MATRVNAATQPDEGRNSGHSWTQVQEAQIIRGEMECGHEARKFSCLHVRQGRASRFVPGTGQFTTGRAVQTRVIKTKTSVAWRQNQADLPPPPLPPADALPQAPAPAPGSVTPPPTPPAPPTQPPRSTAPIADPRLRERTPPIVATAPPPSPTLAAFRRPPSPPQPPRKAKMRPVRSRRPTPRPGKEDWCYGPPVPLRRDSPYVPRPVSGGTSRSVPEYVPTPRRELVVPPVPMEVDATPGAYDFLFASESAGVPANREDVLECVAEIDEWLNSL